MILIVRIEVLGAQSVQIAAARAELRKDDLGRDRVPAIKEDRLSAVVSHRMPPPMAKRRPYEDSADGRSREAASAPADESSDVRRFVRRLSVFAKSVPWYRARFQSPVPGDRPMTAASHRPYDEALLRRAFDVARRSRAAGDHPFGSLLADGEGRALMEQGDGYTSEGGDRTAHAERLLASRAARASMIDFLARCTLYTSAEPCAMCAGAIYWAGIGRVVYGQTEKALKPRPARTKKIRPSISRAPSFRRWSAADRSRRPAARGRSGSAAGGFLEGED